MRSFAFVCLQLLMLLMSSENYYFPMDDDRRTTPPTRRTDDAQEARALVTVQRSLLSAQWYTGTSSSRTF